MEKKCAHDALLDPIRGKWKAEIVYILEGGPRRLGDIESVLPRAIPRVLKRQLRGLEKDGVVERRTYGGVPPKVEYALTEQGRSLYSLVSAMNRAAEEFMQSKKGPGGK